MQWTEALPALYSTINSSEKMPDALHGVASKCSARGAIFVSFNEKGFQYSETFSSSIWAGKAAQVAEYVRRFHKFESQSLEKILAVQFGQPVRDFDVWPEGHQMKLREDVIYIMNLVGVYRRLAYNLSPQVGWKSVFALQYEKNVEEIPEQSFSESKEFLPHLAKVSELLRFVSTLKSRYNAVYSVLDKLNVGVVVLDAYGNIVVANSAANNIAAQADGITIRMGRLHLSDADRNAELDAKIREASLTSHGEHSRSESTLVVRRPSADLPFTLMVSPLNDGCAEIERQFAGTLVFIFDTANPPQIDVAPLAALAALTPTETETTQLLLKGHTDREIADMRSLTYETVRTQIKRVLVKSGVSNRLELVRKAALITPPIS